MSIWSEMAFEDGRASSARDTDSRYHKPRNTVDDRIVDLHRMREYELNSIKVACQDSLAG